MSIFKIWKPVGLTPLEVVNLLKVKRVELQNEKITYAGRLDPLASGILVLLSGADRFNKENYLKLPKTYEVEVLFGLSTDTGDVLGLVEKRGEGQVSVMEIESVIKNFIGRYNQTAPKFSSPSLDGKSFTKEIEIYSIKITDSRIIKSETVLKEVVQKISKVTGDFRQADIVKKWQDVLEGDEYKWLVIKMVVTASSGTYMRVLAGRMGQVLGVPAMAYSIMRTKVGDWSRDDCLDL